MFQLRLQMCAVISGCPDQPTLFFSFVFAPTNVVIGLWLDFGMSQFILVYTFIIKLYNTTHSTCLNLLCPPHTWRTLSRFPEIECPLRCIQRWLHPLRPHPLANIGVNQRVHPTICTRALSTPAISAALIIAATFSGVLIRYPAMRVAFAVFWASVVGPPNVSPTGG